MKLRVKRVILHVARLLGVFALSRALTRRAVRILCYHGSWRVDDGYSGDALFIRPATFARRMQWLRAHAYPVVSLANAVDALSGGKDLPDASVVLTIDDGWYGTYADLLPVLESARFPATLYCDTGHLEYGKTIPHVCARYLHNVLAPVENDVARDAYRTATDVSRTLETRADALQRYLVETGCDVTPYAEARAFSYMTPAELADCRARGLDIQLHTHNHTLYDFQTEQIVGEIRLNREALARAIGAEPHSLTHFCFPSGVTSTRATDALRAAGVVSATTTRFGLEWPGADVYLLHRFLDGDNVSDIEFAAELSGFTHLLRRAVQLSTRWIRRSA